MTPYFQTVKSFADVKANSDGVDTRDFLEASDGLVRLFDLLGNGVFAFVQTDIKNNIAGVRAQYQSTQDSSATLEALVRHESYEHHKHGTPCLVRLIRGLAFTCKALQNMQDDRSSELRVCFRRSYDAVLKHHHTFVIRSIVYVALHAVPHRNDFYNQIAQGESHGKLDAELAKWLNGLDMIVQRMKNFLEEGGWGRV